MVKKTWHLDVTSWSRGTTFSFKAEDEYEARYWASLLCGYHALSTVMITDPNGNIELLHAAGFSLTPKYR